MPAVRLSPKAEQDLEQIGDYIASNNPTRAITFIDELRQACLDIGRAPEAFPLQPSIGPAIRRAVHRRYLIFYMLQPQGVRIERVLHGARNVGGDDFT